MAKKKKKQNCETCNQTCCEGFLRNRITGKEYVILPKKVKEICVDGIRLKRLSRTRWRCVFLKRKKCSIYKNRPPLCRYFYCKGHDRYTDKSQKKYMEKVHQNAILGLMFINNKKKWK